MWDAFGLIPNWGPSITTNVSPELTIFPPKTALRLTSFLSTIHTFSLYAWYSYVKYPEREKYMLIISPEYLLSFSHPHQNLTSIKPNNIYLHFELYIIYSWHRAIAILIMVYVVGSESALSQPRPNHHAEADPTFNSRAVATTFAFIRSCYSVLFLSIYNTGWYWLATGMWR
jgi:hypothetical protein